MPARTNPRSARGPAAGPPARLPWWAVALPVLAFAALLLMAMNPEQAQAAPADPGFGRLVETALDRLSH
ncbi:hypothetical protein OG233_25055 [Streptomyces sp. NBC_01218]|uniref:hypothetical protein n=1 Tax=unclassified Streptomyces TaxID=2593676 RepID=UPI0023B950DF|nr:MULTISPECIES: hypothetical protein [unclassified Streptomyces]WEH42533.1 hypothetical protein PZB77_25215 [Streptomyces sp. AM 2-1-1]WSQ54156.1 hypothetical protein OG233_25055 [Streptomyces sp. NBC_01218]